MSAATRLMAPAREAGVLIHMHSDGDIRDLADMLVDSGMGVVSLREWVPLVTERPLTAVASHTHFDHIGCHHEFEDRAVHAAEAGILADPTRAATLADPYVTDEIFDRLPPLTEAPWSVLYRVAYLPLCLDDPTRGADLLRDLPAVPAIGDMAVV